MDCSGLRDFETSARIHTTFNHKEHSAVTMMLKTKRGLSLQARSDHASSFDEQNGLTTARPCPAVRAIHDAYHLCGIMCSCVLNKKHKFNS